MNIWEEKPKININKLKKKKLSFFSLFRKYPHITINGKGLIAKLRKK